MSIKPSTYFNEPVLERKGDIIPQPSLIKSELLGQMVTERLVLEKRLRVCGLTRDEKSFQLNKVHEGILIQMLSEVDSPFSASLRANIAGVVGTSGLKEAVPILQSIAVEEEEDLKTRVNSIKSYIQLDPVRAMSDLGTLLNSPNPYIRSVTYIASLKSEEESLIRIAKERFKDESNLLVRSAVIHKSPILQQDHSTVLVPSTDQDNGGHANKKRIWIPLIWVIILCIVLAFLGKRFADIPLYFAPLVTTVIVGLLWALKVVDFKKERK